MIYETSLFSWLVTGWNHTAHLILHQSCFNNVKPRGVKRQCTYKVFHCLSSYLYITALIRIYTSQHSSVFIHHSTHPYLYITALIRIYTSQHSSVFIENYGSNTRTVKPLIRWHDYIQYSETSDKVTHDYIQYSETSDKVTRLYTVQWNLW